MSEQLCLFELVHSERPSVAPTYIAHGSYSAAVGASVSFQSEDESADPQSRKAERHHTGYSDETPSPSSTTSEVIGTDTHRVEPEKAEISAKVFEQTCRWVRRRGGLPSSSALKRFSVSLARQYVGGGLDIDAAADIGGKVAAYISRNYDHELAHPPPNRSGRERAADEDRILALYRSGLGNGAPPSVRGLVKALGLSKGKVQRTLEAAGYNPKRQQRIAELSPLGQAVVKVVDRMFSRHGTRAMELSNLCSLIEPLVGEVKIDGVEAAIHELDAAGVNIQMLLTDIRSPYFGSPLLVMCRGHRLDPERATKWLQAQIQKQGEKKRLGLSQRALLISRARIFHHPVARDLAAVLNVCNGSRDLDTWRDFIVASAAGGQQAREVMQPVAFDIPKIVSIAETFVRLPDADPVDLLARMHNWVAEELDRETAAFVFQTASELMQSDNSDAESLQWWAQKTGYRERMQFLGDRDSSDFEKVLCQGDSDDDRSIWNALVALDEYHLGCGKKELQLENVLRPPVDFGFVDGTSHYDNEVEMSEEESGSEWNREGFIYDGVHDEDFSFHALEFEGHDCGEELEPQQEQCVLILEEEIPV